MFAIKGLSLKDDIMQKVCVPLVKWIQPHRNWYKERDNSAGMIS